jgi:hypothetical protein
LIASHNNQSVISGFAASGLVLTLFFFTSIPQTFAQEKSDRTDDMPGNPNYELSQFSDSHAAKEMVKDSINVKPTAIGARARVEAVNTKSKSEEETLSFNFLYFIIQRFKVSEITD